MHCCDAFEKNSGAHSILNIVIGWRCETGNDGENEDFFFHSGMEGEEEEKNIHNNNNLLISSLILLLREKESGKTKAKRTGAWFSAMATYRTLQP